MKKKSRATLLVILVIVVVLIILVFAFYWPPYRLGQVVGSMVGIERAVKYRAEDLSRIDVLVDNPELVKFSQSAQWQNLVKDDDFRKFFLSGNFETAFLNIGLDILKVGYIINNMSKFLSIDLQIFQSAIPPLSHDRIPTSIILNKDLAMINDPAVQDVIRSEEFRIIFGEDFQRVILSQDMQKIFLSDIEQSSRYFLVAAALESDEFRRFISIDFQKFLASPAFQEWIDSEGFKNAVEAAMIDFQANGMSFLEVIENDEFNQKMYGMTYDELQNILRISNDNMQSTISVLPETAIIFYQDPAFLRYFITNQEFQKIACNQEFQRIIFSLTEFREIVIPGSMNQEAGKNAFFDLLFNQDFRFLIYLNSDFQRFIQSEDYQRFI
ncbi:MAG: hypothetical protein JW784_01875 [Candidatus Cloacimonetes bacterium]|nr:hypothetical protein [Candidatus Cloacimonadota bacterium]